MKPKRLVRTPYGAAQTKVSHDDIMQTYKYPLKLINLGEGGRP